MSKNIEVALARGDDKPVIIAIGRWRWTKAQGGIKIKLASTRHAYFRDPHILVKINRQGAPRNRAIPFNLGLTWRSVPTYDVHMRLVDRDRNAIYNYVGHVRVQLPAVMMTPALGSVAIRSDDKS